MAEQQVPPTPKGVVFDACGTLFDVHGPVVRLGGRLGEKAAALSALWRSKRLDHTWLKSLMGCHADFFAVTADALEFAFESFGLTDSDLMDALLSADLEPEAYPEVPAVWKGPRQDGHATAIPSNGSPEVLARAVAHAGLADAFDTVLPVESVGVFKPHPNGYRLGVEALGFEASRLVFVSANAGDVAGASRFGYRTVWVSRFDHRPERLPGRADAEIPDWSVLPAIFAPAGEEG
jgi:2-haloacid dehalogenase